MTVGKLLLLPNLLDESLDASLFLPSSVGFAVGTLQGLIAESEKSARRYLRRFLSHDQMVKVPLRLLNEHTKKQELESLLEPLRSGETWGLISDCGLPCIADPGADLVFLAHQNGVTVETFVGPSSIVMALQLSGFSGQRFSFLGYLPREEEELESRLRKMEEDAKYATQIWIEAPYRSLKMLEALKKVLSPRVMLCIATDLTLPHQRVLTLSIKEWKAMNFSLLKAPCIFLLSVL